MSRLARSDRRPKQSNLGTKCETAYGTVTLIVVFTDTEVLMSVAVIV